MATTAARPPEQMSHPDEPPTKPYHAKRPHKKSRAGCRNCKTRKVKCDEAKPICRSCRLRKADCVYPKSLTASTKLEASVSTRPIAFQREASSSGSSVDSPPDANDAVFSSSDASSALVLSSPRDAGVIYEPQFRPNAVDETDMKLLWFYTTNTYDSFSITGGEEPENIMKDILIRYAFETPFLMNSVFALTGLHLQNLTQRAVDERTLAYRGKAFEGYRKAVEEAKPENYPAIVANSLLMTAISSQNFRDEDAPDLYILDWLVVWKGIHLIIGLVSMSTLVKTGLNCLFFRPPIDLEASIAFIPEHLLFMISSIPPDDPDFPHEVLYFETLKHLGALCMYLRSGFTPTMSLRIITIFTFVSSEFVELARERRPRALIILAHIAIFFKIADSDAWWTKDVGKRTLRDICNYLELEWHYLLTKPLLAINIDDRIELARLVLDDPCWISQASSVRSSAAEISWVDDSGKELCFDTGGQKVYKEVIPQEDQQGIYEL